LIEPPKDVFEVASYNENYGKALVNPFERKCIFSLALLTKREVIKRNAKNDKNFNKHVDGLIVNGLQSYHYIENMAYNAMYNNNHELEGVIQICNFDK